MARAAIFLENTDVPAERSAAELHAELVKAGAIRVSTEYAAGKLAGMHWVMEVNKVPVPFKLPARVDGVFQILRKRQTGSVDQVKLRAKAERIAWRQLYRWVQAQNAMVQAGMAQASEVFMSYAVNDQGRTMFELFFEQTPKMLAAGSSKGGDAHG